MSSNILYNIYGKLIASSKNNIKWQKSHTKASIKSIITKVYRKRLKRYVRYKYACKRCQGNISIGQLPPMAIDKGIPGEGLLAHIITSKYTDHRVQGKAMCKIRDGPLQPEYRFWLQTTVSCVGKEPRWWTLRKRHNEIVSGANRKDERKRTVRWSVETVRGCQNREKVVGSG